MFIKRLLILFAACEFAVYVHGEGTASYSVVPLPQEIKLSQDNPFRLDDKVVVVYPESNPQLRRNAEFLSEYIGQSVSYILESFRRLFKTFRHEYSFINIFRHLFLI